MTTNENITLSNFPKLLQVLEIKISDLQDKILKAFNASIPEYLNYCSSIKTLSTEYEQFQMDLQKLQSSYLIYQANENNSPVWDSRLLLPKLKNLDYITKIVQGALKMHGLFHQFDNAMRNDQPDIASDYLKKADELLETMQCDLNKSEHVLEEIQQENSNICTTKKAGEEDHLFLIHHLRSQLFSKTSQLTLFVSSRLDQFIRIFPHNIEVALTPNSQDFSIPSLTLEQVWHAAKRIGFHVGKESKLLNLIASLIEDIIDPVSTSILKLPDNKNITCNTVITGDISFSDVKPIETEKNNASKDCNRLSCPPCSPPSTALWTCVECSVTQPLQRDTTLKINLLADNLELFFEFVAKYFFPGHPDMLELFGETLWPEFTSFLKTLVAGLNVPSTTLDRLRDFEIKLKGLHVLSFKANTLSLFCRQYDHLIFSERRTRMLSDIRKLCTTMDPAVTAVGHDGSHDVLLKNMQATIELLKTDNISNVNLIESLEESPLVLPKCHVSTAAFETVMMIDNLLKGVLESISLKKIDDNLLTSTIDTVRDAVSFFLFLRSTLHHEHLLKDTQYAAVFYCDLLFLSRRMLLLLPTVEKHIPRIIQARQCQVSLLDLVLTIRPIQEEVFNNMLLYHHKKLVKLCEGIPALTSLSLDEDYMMGEAKIGEIIQELKSLLASWTAVLPNDLTARSFGRLLDTFLTIFLDQITTQTNNSQFSIEDSNALSFLLASSCDQLTAVLTTLPNIDEHTKMWSSFILFKDLINADMSQFISEKKVIRQKLTIKQIQTVLAINVCKTSTSTTILDSLLSTD